MDDCMWLYTYSGDEKYKVKIHTNNNSLCWSYHKNGILLSANLQNKQILTAKFEEYELPKVHVHYVRVVINKEYVTLKREVITFHGEANDCRKLAHAVQELLENQEIQRPKRLLVFVNPGSGNNTNVSDYKKYVAPLLHLCGVNAHVIETSHALEPKEVLADYDLSTIDVVVSMGGDGSLNYVASGLVERTMRDAGATLEHDDDKLIKPSVTFAILPGGTGNCVAQAVYGTLDMEACTAAIILGKRTPHDVMTVHDEDGWIASAYLLVQFGVYFHSFEYLQNLRLLGKFRYLFIPWLLWWYWENHDVQIDYIPFEDDVDKSCIHTSTGIIPIRDGPKPGWKTIQLLLSLVWITPWKQKDFIGDYVYPKYRQPDMSDDKMAIRILRGGTYNQVEKGIFNYDKTYITEIPVKECRIRVDKPGYRGRMIGVDAEKIMLQHAIDYSVRLHSDRLDVIKLDEDLVTEAKLYEI